MATQEAGSQSVSEVDKLPSKDDLASMDHNKLYLLRSKLTEQKAIDMVAPYEHRAFAREFVTENPVTGTVGMVGAIPGYQAAKALGMGSNDTQKTDPSLEQMKQGAIGVGEGIQNAIQKPWEMVWNGLRDAFTKQKAPDRGAEQAKLKPWEMKWRLDAPSPSGKFDVNSYLSTLDKVESGGDPNAANPNSTAVGPYQFTKSTWMENVNKLGLNYTLSDRTNPEKAKIVAEAFTKDKVAQATTDLGRTPTKAEAYMYHLLGNARDFLTSKPDTPATETVSKKAVNANKNVFLNKDGSSKTVGEVFAKFEAMFGREKRVDSGQVESGNIDLNNRPVVKNSDGTISTVRSMGVNMDGVEVLIPTVVDGKVVSKEEAIAEYKKTGKHLGKFSSVEASNAYAEKLHNDQAKLYKGR